MNRIPKLGARWLIAIWVFSAVIGFLPSRTSASSNFSYNTTVTYRVQSDGRTDVTEHYSITNNTPRLYLSEIKLSTPTDSLNGLRAAYEDGGSIPATSTKQTTNKGDLGFNYQQINITFPRQLYGQGKTWAFDVHYVATGLVDSRGGSHAVFVPSIEPSEGTDKYEVRVEVPTSFGGAHFAGAKSASGGVSDGYQYFTFSRDELVKHSLALAFGDINLYELNFNFPLDNNSPLPKTMTIALPPDLNNQKSYIKKLTPAPANTRLDQDGNVLADYRVGAGQHIIVVSDVIGEVKRKDYNLNRSGKKSDIPPELVQAYTGSSKYWNTGGDVGAAAGKLSDPNAPVINNVKAMYQFVIDKLSYNKDKIKFNIRQGSAQALAHPDNAVCLEYADLLVAMLRSQGIPARMPVGYGYSGSLKNSADVADSLHSWVEAYVPGIGWMTLDPTWGEKFDEFGTSDLDHFAFTVWGRDDNSPTAVMSGSRDDNYQYDHAALKYAPSLATKPPIGGLKVVRYALLPGISLDRVTATSNVESKSDSNMVGLESELVSFGSLAPGQEKSLFRLELGTGWVGTPDAVFNADGVLLASSKTKLTYWPLIVFIVLIIAGVLSGIRKKTKPVTQSPYS